jgi:hypothetical protein
MPCEILLHESHFFVVVGTIVEIPLSLAELEGGSGDMAVRTLFDAATTLID